jgi:tripartite-type tricarboxylate transporter receptor subunit TctC
MVSLKGKSSWSFLPSIGMLALCTFIVGSPAAQSYPSKQIRLIVSTAAGSSPDIASRHLALELSRQIGEQVIVDNRPGASGIIAYEMLSRAAPDGYTLGYIPNSFAANQSLFASLPYDTVKSFAPIILFASSPNLLAVTTSFPVRSIKELIDVAKAKPGALSYGATTYAASGAFAMEQLKLVAGINVTFISYKANQQAITDAIGGQIQLVCEPMSSILPHVKASRMRGLGVTSLKRAPAIPELPTFDESGFAGFEVINWGRFAFPSRVAPSIVNRLNNELNRVLSIPTFAKAIEDRGARPEGGTPKHFENFMSREIEKWGKVARAVGIKPQ